MAFVWLRLALPNNPSVRLPLALASFAFRFDSTPFSFLLSSLLDQAGPVRGTSLLSYAPATFVSVLLRRTGGHAHSSADESVVASSAIHRAILFLSLSLRVRAIRASRLHYVSTSQ